MERNTNSIELPRIRSLPLRRGWLGSSVREACVEREKNMNDQKNNTSHRPGFLSTSWDASKTARAEKQGINRLQQAHLRALVSYARAHSMYFADLYR